LAANPSAIVLATTAEASAAAEPPIQLSKNVPAALRLFGAADQPGADAIVRFPAF